MLCARTGSCEEYFIEDLWHLFCGHDSLHFPHNYISSTMPSTMYSEIINQIINDDELTNELTSLLQKEFLSISHYEWDTAFKDYIQYLVAWVIGNGLGIKTAPSFHVDILWTMHLVETMSYRNLEKLVIKKVKEINEDIVQVEHIEHTKHIHKKTSRVKATRTLYSLLGFLLSDGDSVEHNTSDQMSTVGSIESVRPRIAVTPKKQDTGITGLPAKQVIITGKREEGGGDKKEHDTLDLILKLTGGIYQK